jgi:alpha/beta superfamily hydrolase
MCARPAICSSTQKSSTETQPPSPPLLHLSKPRHQDDNFTTISQLDQAVAKHDATRGAGPLEVRVVHGADHFFFDRWNTVAAAVQEWLGRQLAQAKED